MKIIHKLIIVLAVLVVNSSGAQTIYYCVKNGKKVVSNQSCEDQGAVQKKRVDPQDAPPMNITQPIKPSQIKQNREQDRQDPQVVTFGQKGKSHLSSSEQDRCDKLWQRKLETIEDQRRMNNDWLTAEHKRINDELYALRCETL